MTLSLSENDDGDSSDSNPIDFCSSNDLLAAASGDMIKIFKIQIDIDWHRYLTLHVDFPRFRPPPRVQVRHLRP